MTNSSKNNKIIFLAEQGHGTSLLSSVILNALFALLFAVELAAPVLYGALGEAYKLGTGIGVAALMAAAISALIPIAVFKIAGESKKKQMIAFAAIVLVAGIVSAIFRKLIRSGALVYINCVLGNRNQKNGGVVSFYETDGAAGTIGIIMLLVCVVLVWTIFTLVFLRYRQVVLLTVIAFAFLVGEVLAVSSFPLWAALATGLLVIMAVAANGADRDVFAGKWGLAIGIVVLAAVICAVVFALSGLHSDGVKDLQKKLTSKVEEIVFGKSDLTAGDFTNIGNRIDSSAPRLQVSGVDGDIYLKGFTGSKYTGNGFEDLDEQAYKNENLWLFQWLSDPDSNGYAYSPVTGLAYALDNAVSADKRAKVHQVQVDIKNVGASGKYLYVPYGFNQLTVNGGQGPVAADYYNKDLNVKNSLAGQVKEYSVRVSRLGMNYEDRDSFALLTLDEQWTDSGFIKNNFNYYAEREQNYDLYVQDNYLAITQAAADYLDSIGLKSKAPMGEYRVTSYIRNYLISVITYSDYPKNTFGKGGADKDFVVNLLQNDKEGYDVHFAAASTVLFRYLGIPARYVEGYIKAGNNETVTASDAHAWVEIYRSGLGWVPIEVTPDYYKVYNPERDGNEDGNRVEDAEDPEKKIVVIIEEEQQTNANLLPLFIIPAIIIAAILAIFIRRLIILLIRNKKIKSGNYKYAISVMAGLILRNAAFAGVTLRKDFPTEDAQVMDPVFAGEGGSNQYRPVALAIARAYYGTHGATREDVNTVRRYWLSTIRTLYKNKKTIQKLKLRFIDVVD